MLIIFPAKNGVAPAVAAVKFSAASAAVSASSVAIGAGADLSVVLSKNDAELDIPPGDAPLILYTWQTEGAGQTVPIIWTGGGF